MHNNAGKIMTVLGAIEPEDLGRCLPHEHTVVDCAYLLEEVTDPVEAEFFHGKVTMDKLNFLHRNPYAIYENCFSEDTDVVVRELQRFKNNGGSSICELGLQTCITNERFKFIKGDDGKYKIWIYPKRISDLVDISTRSGVNIISSIGVYVQKSHPPIVKELTVDQLADCFIDIVKNGYNDSGVYPGILGETGVSTLTEDEIKVLRATAITQQETGLGINIHIDGTDYRYDFYVLDILEESGADLTRVALSHRDNCITDSRLTFDKAVDHYCALADRGAFVELDGAGNTDLFHHENDYWQNPADYQRAQAIHDMCMRGHAKQILISHDLAHLFLMEEYGGNGYSHVLKGFRTTLMNYNVCERDFDQITIGNPKRLLTIQ